MAEINGGGKMNMQIKNKDIYIYSSVSLCRVPFWAPVKERLSNKQKIWQWKNSFGEIMVKSPVLIGQRHRDLIEAILAFHQAKKENQDESTSYLVSLGQIQKICNLSKRQAVVELAEDMMQAIITVSIFSPQYFSRKEQFIWEVEEFEADWAIDQYAKRASNIFKNNIYLWHIKFSPLFTKLFLNEIILFCYNKEQYRKNIEEIIKIKDAKLKSFIRFCIAQKNGKTLNAEFILQQIGILDSQQKGKPAYRKEKSKFIATLRDNLTLLQEFGMVLNSKCNTVRIEESNKKFYFGTIDQSGDDE